MHTVENFKARILSIDVVRGVVMIIMALDHVRDYTHYTAMTDDPLNLETTTLPLFFTRWITHFCAPIFVFLSGTSIYLVSLKRSKSRLSNYLLKRGLWLILAEVTVVTFGWTFDPGYKMIILQVIWAIGISMTMLSVLIWLPFRWILVIAMIIIFGHNLLDYPEAAANGQIGFWWDLFHHGKFAVYPVNQNHALVILYPFVPWTGLMLGGFCLGKLYTPGSDPVKRRHFLVYTGLGMIILFIIIRFINEYGDPNPWSVQRTLALSICSFIKVHKYPPSLLYMTMTIGPALVLLALMERVQNSITRFFNIFGRVPMFYYILHIYLIHIICAGLFFMSGHTVKEAFAPGQFFGFRPNEFGYPLWIVYMIWTVVILLLYPLCRRYDQYKSTHSKWWLSYL